MIVSKSPSQRVEEMKNSTVEIKTRPGLDAIRERAKHIKEHLTL